jgi:UDP:flavonoid glycosyltransferase YjiC (YdhE family)
VFRTDYDGPRLPGAALGARVPVALKRLQYWLADRVVIDRILAPAVNGFRAELGLPTQRRLLKDWWNSPQLVLGAFPEWFAPPQPDRPPQTVLTGFPLYDEGDLGEPSDEVREFIAAGGPPIAFTPGSANVHGREFFAVAVEACHRLGRRGVLLTRFPDQLPANLPNTVRHFDFVPFGWLLPRSAAVVHHGGIGSTAQGLAAGVPQLLMPLGFDQFDNAARIERLGCGDWLPLRRFTAANVTAVLARLLESPSVAEACRRTASLSRGQRALTAMCEAIERLGSATQRAIPGVA